MVIALFALIVGFATGFGNLRKFFLWLFLIILGAATLFLLAYVFWLLFIKVEFKDIPAQWRKKLEMSAKLAKNDMLGKLYVSGDEKHNRLCYGKYMYLRINMPKIMKEQIIEKGKPKLDDFGQPVFKDYTEEMPLDCFIVEQKGFFSRLFGDPFFILVYPKDHDYSSVFNDVCLSEDTWVLVKQNNICFNIAIKNITEDMWVSTFNKKGKQKWTKIKSKTYIGIKECINFVTKKGREVICTPEHRFVISFDDSKNPVYCEAKNLSINSTILVNEFGKIETDIIDGITYCSRPVYDVEIQPIYIYNSNYNHLYFLSNGIWTHNCLKGFNLVPLDNYFYTIDRHNLDIDLHKAIEMNYIKEAVVEQLRDLDKLVKGAINLDSKFFKDKERATEFELPALDKMRGNQQQ